MAPKYRHICIPGNRVGLHYSHFRRFSQELLLTFSNLRGKKNRNRIPIREVGLGIVGLLAIADVWVSMKEDD